MKIALLTREYPPEVYGGAGVHVAYLARELAERAEVDVHCFGAPRATADAHQPWPALDEANPALRTLSVDLVLAAATAGADVVHSHTWYANLGGHLAKLLHDIPHVLTTHSLEPLRPWKAEQLGAGYAVSSWCERSAVEAAEAVIAVSEGMRADVLTAYPKVDPAHVHVVHNGIDTEEYHPDARTDALLRCGVEPERPYVLFVGRITRQKGLPRLLAAARDFAVDAQLVLCADSPDTPEIGAEVAAGIAALQTARDGVVWIRERVAQPDLVQLLTHAAVFVCPSVYEPLGIVNLEAMACQAPVVATATGGIPEVVADGKTGLLVPPDAQHFESELAERVNALLADPALARSFGAAGRRRAVAEFGWPAIAERTLAVYESVLG